MDQRQNPPFHVDGKTITCMAPDGQSASLTVELDRATATGRFRVTAPAIPVGAIARHASIHSADVDSITMARDLTVADLRSIIRQEIRASARAPRG